MIGVRCAGDARELGERLADIPEVKYVVQTAGSFDVLAEVVCVDDGELLDVLNGRIRALPGVVSTETFVYLKIAKDQYTWAKR
jgi:Lrp/AsnC family transcriptional regulator for asnA, asnC and gidA